MRRLYLDHAATTPVAPEVWHAMEPWLRHQYGNPSSLHAEGRRAKDAIDETRERVSQALGCEFGEIVFTSGGTESANLALIGAALANPNPARKRILVSAAEHHCVLHTKPTLEALGFEFQTIPVDRFARVNLNQLRELLSEDVLLVSVMHANNELGSINPVGEVARLAHEKGALVHCDAVQTFCQPSLKWNVNDLGADLVTVSGHKIQAAKGVGALYVRAGTKVKPTAVGGGQEREMRAGTENVAAIVGFGEAIGLVRPQTTDLGQFRASLADLVEWSLDGDTGPSLPGHAHGRVPGVDAETLLIRLDRMGVSASSGAACSSGSLEASHVLLACGYSQAEAKQGIRFTFGIAFPAEDLREAAGIIRAAITEIRAAARS
ncbi:MAG: cysteine desulfurase family protein [Fimbriimonas sp.]